MGELADDFAHMKQARQDHRAEVEPKRIDYAVKQLHDAGHTVQILDHQTLKVNATVTLWPFTGWYSGKGIGNGRGIHNLLKALSK